jgi:hypothetical protein
VKHETLKSRRQVRAIIMVDEFKDEASMEVELGRSSGLGEDVFLAQVCVTTNKIQTPGLLSTLEGDRRLISDYDECVWQLLRRATLLNVDFQARVFSVIASHAVSDELPDARKPRASKGPWQGPDHPLEPASLDQKAAAEAPETLPAESDAGGCQAEADGRASQDLDRSSVLIRGASDGFNRPPSEALSRIYAAQNVVTASVVLSGSGPADLPRLGRAASLWSHAVPSTLKLGGSHSKREMSAALDHLRNPSLSTFTSSTTLSVPEVQCRFLSRSGPVWVIPAPEKAMGRMREKVAEYRSQGAPWPRAGSILDPVRATVVCQGPAEMLEVAEWFLSGSGGADPFPVCRVKNKFAQSAEELVRERPRASLSWLPLNIPSSHCTLRTRVARTIEGKPSRNAMMYAERRCAGVIQYFLTFVLFARSGAIAIFCCAACSKCRTG